MPLSPRLLSMLSAALMLVAAGAWADPPGRGTQPPVRRVTTDTLSDSVRRVERATQGQVLSAERVPFDGRSVNRIKVIDDRGRVRVYMDDPQSQQRPAPTRDDDD